jgi:hypothetical protein
MSFDATQLGRWDSALIVFLWALRAKAAKCGVTFDPIWLAAACATTARVNPHRGRAGGDAAPARRAAGSYRTSGDAGWSEIVEVLVVVGETVLRSVPAPGGRAGVRFLPEGIFKRTCLGIKFYDSI